MKQTTDCLIIGSGISGLTAAIQLAEKGFKVTVLHEGDDIKISSSYLAQGGIIYRGNSDSPELLKQDIIEAGAYMNYQESIDRLVNDGIHVVKDVLLKKVGVPFSEVNGELIFTGEGAHSDKRILYVKDYTGKAIIDSLLKYINKNNLNIEILSNHHAIDLITYSHSTLDKYAQYKNDRCLGAYVYCEKKDCVKEFGAKVTILATGGLGQIFSYTTNPKSTYGSGYAMAYRAGVGLINMEYTQFHPTALYSQTRDNFLVSEAVRGEGAVLVNQNGYQFMKDYHKLGSLAPRDVVARSIVLEMQKYDDPYVYLDISKLETNFKERFPSIYERCVDEGIDIDKELIPVVPSFHFQCGGIKVDRNGLTSLNNLYAIGEVSCTGIHGANRLASTSLLEGVSWASFAADDISSRKLDDCPIDTIKEWEYTGKEEYDSVLINQDLKYLRNIMWNYVGLIRTSKRLQRAISDLTNLRNTADQFYYDSNLNKEVFRLRNAITNGLIIAKAAWRNKSSAGCHYRVD